MAKTVLSSLDSVVTLLELTYTALFAVLLYAGEVLKEM